MSKRSFFCKVTALALVVVAAPAWAGEGSVTFHKDVLPILQENCQVCHRTMGADMGGMVAPMPLQAYKDVRPWAKAIAKQVSARSMPPWHASQQYSGVFINERTLTDTEIATITRWVETGARPGNPADAPEPIDWPTSGWSIGEPDLIVTFDEPHWVGDDVTDEYANIEVTITKEMLAETKWIQAAEIHNGSEVVHHVIARPLAGNAPGIGARFYKEGYGARLDPGTVVTFNMHYHKEPGPGTGVWDQTEIGLKFHTKPVTHSLRSTAIGNRSFEIPPGHPNWKVGASMFFDKDTLLISMMPHMHLRGKDAKYTAYYPDGTTEKLLDVPLYDFNWQTPYEYPEGKLLPKGTRVDVEMHFDNSSDNPYNPDPTAKVVFAGPTTAEMMLGWISITDADPQSESNLANAAFDSEFDSD